jgi:hypothetical protein
MVTMPDQIDKIFQPIMRVIKPIALFLLKLLGKDEALYYRFLDNLVLWVAERGSIYLYVLDERKNIFKKFVSDHKRLTEYKKDMIKLCMPWGGAK